MKRVGRPITLIDELTARPLASPCDVAWDDMRGDDRVRRCDECSRDVFDLSAMSAREAEARLLNAGTLVPCIRYARNNDGNIAHRKPRTPLTIRRASVASAAALSLSLVASSAQAKDEKAPAQCVAYTDSPVISALDAPKPTATREQSRPPMLAGKPAPPQQEPDSGTLKLRSKDKRTVTIVGITLTAPLDSYRLTPGDFIADVQEADGRVRQVKFTVKKDKTTIVDLDKK